MLDSMRAPLFGALLALPLAAAAQQDLPLWEIGVVGGAVSTPAYPGAADRSSRLLLLPAPIYRGKIFRSDESGIGARLFRSDRVEFDVGFAASLPSRSDDVEAREGMPDLGTLVEFGPRLKLTLSRREFSRLRLDLPLRTVIEGRGGLRNQGWNFAPRLVYEMDDTGTGWNGDVHLGLVTASEKLNGYFYDVRPEFATAQRPAYDAEKGLVLVRAGGFAQRKINPDLRVFGYLWYETYAKSANDQSPLFRKNNGASAGIGFLWTLARSTRRAND
jgi:outer membrane scaffolding protein for murein synthesis (MipA/OmpV family)